MGLVLDTSAYSAAGRNNIAVRQAMSDADSLIMPVIVVGELKFGFNKGTRLADNERLLKEFTASERVSIALIDADIADVYAKLKARQVAVGKNLGENDLWIAAVCLHLQLPLLTRDTDFEKIEELELVDLNQN